MSTERRLLSELQELHQHFGYGSTEQLVIALRAARRGTLVTPKPLEMRQRYTRKTPQMLKQFVALTKRGKTIAEIAVTLNISAKSVTDLRSKYGFSKPRKPRRRNVALDVADRGAPNNGASIDLQRSRAAATAFPTEVAASSAASR